MLSGVFKKNKKEDFLCKIIDCVAIILKVLLRTDYLKILFDECVA